MYVPVLEEELGEALGVDEGWLPLPNYAQQYCDPASLVSLKCDEMNDVRWIYM